MCAFKIDVATAIFDNDLELKLMHLQALSFELVDPSIIGNIFIVYNDKNSENFKFNTAPKLADYYPIKLRDKLKFIYSEDLGIDTRLEGWFTQQQAKLLVAHYVSSDYYLVLDAKNHFIRETGRHSFFSTDAENKPYLFLSDSGPMISRYLNCLSYFQAKNEFRDIKQMPTTITPYIFITKYVRELLKFITKKEYLNIRSTINGLVLYKFNHKKIKSFFLYHLLTRDGDDSCTEFYLYAAYVAKKEKFSSHNLKPINLSGFCVFSQDPKLHFWNSFEAKDEALKDESIKIFGLHRKVINILDTEYQTNLLKKYREFYKEETIQYIGKNILINAIKI